MCRRKPLLCVGAFGLFLYLLCMFISLCQILFGALFVLLGADRLTEGAVAVAERLRIPQIVIGLTVVALGTSMPEFTVSLVAALKGTPDLAVGNVIGSNIFNVFAIVGIAAMIAPMTILSLTVKRDLPFALVAALLLVVFGLDGNIGRLDAAALFLLFVIYMIITVRQARAEAKSEDNPAPATQKNLMLSIFWLLIGLTALVLGSNQFVDGASAVAQSLGVSEAVIGLTIVAMGTSLPELATSVVAARKGNSGIAIGNVIGSNVFNILFILGATGVISPMRITGITTIDYTMLVLSMLSLWFFSYTRLRIERWEGGVLFAVFLTYMSWLIINAV